VTFSCSKEPIIGGIETSTVVDVRSAREPCR